MADHVTAGEQDDVDRPLSNAAVALTYVTAHRTHRLEDHRRWLYSPEPEQPGAVARAYTVGLLLMRHALDRLELDPWGAAALPAGALIDAGMAAILEDADAS